MDRHALRLPKYLLTAGQEVGIGLTVALVFVGFAFRLVNIGERAVTNDESFTWRVIQFPASETIQRVAEDGHAPAYFLFVQLWSRIFGDSPERLRQFSVLFGIAAVVMIGVTCREAAKMSLPDVSRNRNRETPNGSQIRGTKRLTAPHNIAAFVGVSFAAIAPLQIDASRTARMYSFGAFLTAFATWLLLRALQAPAKRGPWLMYGLAAALMGYTHYFGFFTLLAHAVFLFSIAVVCPFCDLKRRNWQSIACGVLLATSMAFACYAVWTPTLLLQVHAVRTNFWIPELETHEIATAYTYWLAGAVTTDAVSIIVLTAIAGFAAALAVSRFRAVGLLFLWSAAVPWVCCLIVSTWGGRPLLQERYLTFSQVGLIGLIALGAAAFPYSSRAFAAGAFVVACATGAWNANLTKINLGGQKDALAMMRHVCRRYEPGDVIMVGHPACVNQVRWLAKETGVRHLNIRCVQSVFPHNGHDGHVAALTEADVVFDQQVSEFLSTHRRVWTIDGYFGNVRPYGETHCKTTHDVFGGGQSPPFVVILWSLANECLVDNSG